MAPVKTNIEQALETMKASGLKYTKKRELLMSYLIKRNRYVSAREVYEFMNETFKGVSYDTVYRNLHDFERLELLEKTELNGEQKFRFRCCQEVEHQTKISYFISRVVDGYLCFSYNITRTVF